MRLTCCVLVLGNAPHGLELVPLFLAPPVSIPGALQSMVPRVCPCFDIGRMKGLRHNVDDHCRDCVQSSSPGQLACIYVCGIHSPAGAYCTPQGLWRRHFSLRRGTRRANMMNCILHMQRVFVDMANLDFVRVVRVSGPGSAIRVQLSSRLPHASLPSARLRSSEWNEVEFSGSEASRVACSRIAH